MTTTSVKTHLHKVDYVFIVGIYQRDRMSLDEDINNILRRLHRRCWSEICQRGHQTPFNIDVGSSAGAEVRADDGVKEGYLLLLLLHRLPILLFLLLLLPECGRVLGGLLFPCHTLMVAVYLQLKSQTHRFVGYTSVVRPVSSSRLLALRRTIELETETQCM